MKIYYLLFLVILFNFTVKSQTYTIDQNGSHATCSATLYDSGGSGGNYANNENNIIKFCSNNSTCIKVVFTSFNLDSNDYLYIYNGPNTASQLLAVLTGNSLPPSYSSFFGCLTFQFVSNDTITSSGFEATLSCETCTFSGGGSGTLTPAYDNQACGLNYVGVTQKVTTRYATPPGTGLPSTLNVSTLPPNGTCWSVEKALLYWTESSNSNGAVTTTVTNPIGTVFNYNVSPVGVGIDKCWGTTFTTNYRIDVTAAITGNGNYSVDISSGSWNVDGISLLIIYRDLTASYTGRFMVNDGLIVSSAGDPSFVTINNVNSCATSTYANAFLMVGDMQDGVSPPTHSTTLNGAALTFSNDFWNNDQTTTTVTIGQPTAQFGTAPSGGDCYSVVAAGLYYQTACLTCPSNAFAVPITQTVQTCTGGDIVANPGGGSPPFSFLWNTGSTSANLTGLGPGTYSVTVTDGIGCQAVNSITLTNPLPITNNATISNISCSGANNGNISVVTSGGTPNYGYSWNTGATSSSINSLSAGTYILTTSDNLGCNRQDTFNITSPMPLNIGFNTHNILCYGTNTGSIQSSVSGGILPYTYSWNNGSILDSISNLASGTYILTVLDSNGCSFADSTTIIEPSVFSVVLNGSNLTCFGNSSGTITSSINGGTSPYNVVWNNGATTANLTSLSAGSYFVNVTDNHGCSVADSVTLTEPSLLQNSFGSVNVLCNGYATGNTSSITVGGTSPYSYLWNNGATTSNITNLVAGDYIVGITDSQNCILTDTISITEPSALVLVPMANATCKDSCFGGVSVNYSGGVPPYQLIWSTGDTNTTFLTNLCKGSYQYVLTDGNNCVVSDSIQVGLLSQIQAYFVLSPDSGFVPIQVSFTDQSTGTIIGWLWNFGDNNTSTIQNPNNTYNNNGSYPVTLTVVDSLGCTDTYTVELTVLPESTILVPNVFTPNGDGVNDVFTIKSSFLKSSKGEVFNRWGQKLYEWSGAKGYWNGRTLSGNLVPDGTYFYIIEFETLKSEKQVLKGTVTLLR